MQEEVTREGNTIVALSLVEPGEFVRRKGADLAKGQQMFSAGEPVTVQSLALLASQGLAEVEVGSRPKVTIVSTGDELVPPGTTPASGQIFESNSVMLEALALGAGAEIAIVQHCPDNLEQLTELFRRALETDALIVSGGVSVGEHDLVKLALRALGAELDLWRVAIKPGKPFLFGRAGRAAIFGLPGNPVSSFVTFLKFVRPALLKMSGAAKEWLALRQVAARLGAELTNEGERPHYVRGRLQEGVFTPTGRQESHALFGLSRANALLRVAAGEKLRADASVSVELWD
jgi:molybdopterin molybdotransferase